MKIKDLNLNDILIIDNEWVLRKDDNYLVLYKVSISETRTIKLSPLLSSFIVLIDGKRTLDNLIKSVKFIFNIDSHKESIIHIEKLINIINKESAIIKLKNINNNINIFNTNNYFIPLDEYKTPKNNRLDKPTNIRLAISNKCTTNCIYCYADRHIKINKELSLIKWKSIIDECIHLNIRNIELAGGDPLCDNKSISVMEYLLQNEYPLFISSKSDVDNSTIDRLISAGILKRFRGIKNIVQYSIDSVDPVMADYLVNSKDYLKNIDNTLEKWIISGVSLRIKCVLTQLNYKEIIPIIEKYRKFGIKSFQFVYYGLSYYKPQPLLLLSNGAKEYIHKINKSIINMYPNINITIQDEFGLPYKCSEESWKKRAACSGGYSGLSICVDGSIILCDQLPNNKDFTVGNINDNTLIEIWKSDKLEKWLFPDKESFLGSVCYNCTEFGTCIYAAGWCYRDSLFAYDTIFEAPPRCPYQSKTGKILY